MPSIIKVSSSQVEEYLRCPRRWAFAHICRRWAEESRGTALGKRVHVIHEAYLRDGIVPDSGETWIWENDPKRKVYYPGRIALSMMPRNIYPAPRTGELEFRATIEIGGVHWTIVIDWHRIVDPSSIIIIDHKTSADPQQYAKSSESLKFEPQPLMYARAISVFHKLPKAVVTAHWSYGCTDASPRKARVSTAYFEPAETRAAFDRLVLPVGKELVRLRTINADPLNLPFNADACFDYHKPCRFVDDCKLTTKERLGCIIMGNPLVDSLLAESEGENTSVERDATPIPPKVDGDIVNPSDIEDDTGPPLSDVDPPASTRPQVPLDDEEVASDPPPKTAARRGRPPKTAQPSRDTRTVDAGVVDITDAASGDLIDRIADKVADRIADKVAARLFKN